MIFLLCFRVGEWTIFIDFVCFRFRFSYLVHLHNDSEVSSKGFSFRELFIVVFAKKDVYWSRWPEILCGCTYIQLPFQVAQMNGKMVQPLHPFAFILNINVQALLFVSPCLWFDLFSPGHRCLSTWWPSKWSSWVTQWWFVWVVDQLQWGFNMIQSMMTFHTEWSKYMNGNETLAHAQSQDVSYDYTFEYKHWTQKLVVCRYLSFSKGFFFSGSMFVSGVCERFRVFPWSYSS